MNAANPYRIVRTAAPSSPAPSTTTRPTRFADIVGQDSLVQRLSVHLDAAVARGVQPPHILLDGPPGTGKTTLGRAISGELNTRGVASSFRSLTPHSIPTVRKLVIELSQLTTGDVIMIDEVQDLPTKLQNMLLTVLEDGWVSVESGRGPAQQFQLPALTVVLATTEPAKIVRPLRDRFGFTAHIEPYAPDDLALVLIGYCERAGIDATVEAVEIIARAGRFTPRIAQRLMDSCRDRLLQETNDPHAKIDADAARAGLAFAQVDEYGLDNRDRRVLTALCVDHLGGPIGIGPLSASLGMAPAELSRDVEPYLLSSGLLSLLKTGRAATFDTYEALGLDRPILPYGLGR